MKKLILFVAAMVSAFSLSAAPKTKEYKVASPDGKIEVVVSVGENLSYTVLNNGKVMIAPSAISMNFEDGTVWGAAPKLKAKTIKSCKQNIAAPTSARAKEMQLNYNELELVGSKFGVTFRVFDNGAAYRFYTNDKKLNKILVDEVAEFNFEGDPKAFLPYSVSEGHPFDTSCEPQYTVVDKLSDFNPKKMAILPTLVDLGDKGKVILMQSDVENYACMQLVYDADKKGLSGKLARYPKSFTKCGVRCKQYVNERETYAVKVSGARTFPWRVMGIANEDRELPMNNLVYMLASPNRIGDTSWIKYGKSAWDWWNNWKISNVDFKAGINTATYKYYIDFAAKYGLEYIILDEGWTPSEKGNILVSRPEINLPEIVNYGKEKGVGVIIWVVGKVLDNQLEEAVKLHSDMGVAGYKVDFIDRNDQEAVQMIYRIAEATAKHKLVVDFHGIYQPTGLSRTYPNVINYEGVFGLEQLKWSNPNMPLYDVTMPFIRMVPGPVDYTQGAMRNCAHGIFREIYSAPMSQGTRSHQVGTYVVFDSPFVMLCDTPTHYELEPACTQFIAKLTTNPDETKVLDGKVGEYIITARREGSNWYVGGITSWAERTVKVDMSFLGEGTYNVEMMIDGLNANRVGEDYKIVKKQVTAKDTLEVYMARGGGFAMVITK